MAFRYREDDSRIRKGFGAENMATLRRLALSLLKRESTKQSIATKRLMAAREDDYLFHSEFSSRLVMERNIR